MKTISTHRARRALRDLLVAARDDAKLTQREVARRLGRHQSYVARYEKGRRRLYVLEFMAIAEALGIDPMRLLRAFMRKLE